MKLNIFAITIEVFCLATNDKNSYPVKMIKNEKVAKTELYFKKKRCQ